VDGHKAHLANNDMSIMSSTTAHGTLDSLSTVLDLCHQQAVNDNLTVLTINHCMFAQLCINLNHQVNDPALWWQSLKQPVLQQPMLKATMVRTCTMLLQVL
jgi:hypothetical protein